MTSGVAGRRRATLAAKRIAVDPSWSGKPGPKRTQARCARCESKHYACGACKRGRKKPKPQIEPVAIEQVEAKVAPVSKVQENGTRPTLGPRTKERASREEIVAKQAAKGVRDRNWDLTTCIGCLRRGRFEGPYHSEECRARYAPPAGFDGSAKSKVYASESRRG